MISAETRAQIRLWFFAEHWKIGTIAQALRIHPDTVRHAIESDRFHRVQTLRACVTDPYLPFIRQTLDQHPRLRATRIYHMIRDRGYQGSIVQLRRAVATLRPIRREPFLRLHTFPAEDYGEFCVMVRDSGDSAVLAEYLRLVLLFSLHNGPIEPRAT